jgi:hypothetical protein
MFGTRIALGVAARANAGRRTMGEVVRRPVCFCAYPSDSSDSSDSSPAGFGEGRSSGTPPVKF